jgi:hypothetical protein
MIFDGLALGGQRLFCLFQRRFRRFYFFLVFFRGHHLLKLRVFGFASFRVGIGDFMLQRFVGFVGLYGGTLRAEFLAAFAPLGNFKFGFLARCHHLGVRFFSGSDCIARAGQLLVQLADAFGSSVQFGAEHCDFLIGLLELQELRNRGMHEESLAQRFDG